MQPAQVVPKEKLIEGFKAFLLKTNALALAIGVIIGAATSKLVASLVGDLLMPIIVIPDVVHNRLAGKELIRYSPPRDE